MTVVAEAGDGQTGVRLVHEHMPDVVVMDIAMPGMNGIEATGQIIAAYPATKVIGLSMHADKRFITAMLQAGALAYMPKDCSLEELAQAIRTVVANKMYLSPTITRTVVTSYLHQFNNINGARVSPLTHKEREVLGLLAQGKSTREIANSLGVSVKTVETHRQHITEKLDLRSLADLVKYAIREGIASLDE